MSGPPPKDPATCRRRNPTPGFKLLPHEGRQGETPPWPIPQSPDPTFDALEQRKWRELWCLPQSVEWERMRDFGTVALYVRVFVEASLPGADAKLLVQLSKLDAQIGVSPQAMRNLRWETDEPLPDPEPEPEAPAAPKRRLIASD